MNLNVYPTPNETAASLIRYILLLMKRQPEKVFNIAFSGGRTPAIMFDIWADEFADVTPWKRLKVWWVDERCVPPKDLESNYGLMRKYLLDTVPIPHGNIIRIHGEANPEEEAQRYSKLVEERVPYVGNLPSFDIVLLGIGNDGHTSSIFPGQEHLLSSSRLYEVSVNPGSGQKRIALTGKPILNAQYVIYLVTGKDKANILHEIYTSGDTTPAGYIARRAGNIAFFADKEAAANLK